MRDSVLLKLGEDSRERGLVGYAYDNDVRNFAVRMITLSDGVRRMIGLDDLMLEGNVLPYEAIEISVSNLCHGENHFIPRGRNVSRDFLFTISAQRIRGRSPSRERWCLSSNLLTGQYDW